jgi:hypothetical protein
MCVCLARVELQATQHDQCNGVSFFLDDFDDVLGTERDLEWCWCWYGVGMVLEWYQHGVGVVFGIVFKTCSWS